MQSNPQPNLANINQLFNQYDQDHDGKVNKQQIQSILKDVGYTDVYSGTIKKIIRLVNQRDGQIQSDSLNFLQVEEYAEAMASRGKFKVWKTTLQNRANIAEMVRELKGDQQNEAAPGASPTGPSGNKGPDHQNGEISINVGNLAQCPQFIRFFLEKQKGQQTKPYLRLVIERNNANQAKQLQTSFKAIYDTVIEILKVEQQALIDEILSVNFDTKVQGNVFTLTVSTQNQGLIQLVEVFTESLDQLMNSSINGKIQGQYRFDFDFEKFISDPSYNFYGMFVRNSMLNLKWNVWDLFDGLRKFALKAQVFEDLKWSATDPFLIFLIGLLHCERFNGRLEFENTSTQNQQIESKQEIIQFFKQLRRGLTETGEDMNLDFVKMIEHLEGKLFIEAGVKDWRFRFEAKVSGLSKIFVQEMKQAQEQDETYEHVQQTTLNQSGPQCSSPTLKVTPPSSPKLLTKQSSKKSLKKIDE